METAETKRQYRDYVEEHYGQHSPCFGFWNPGATPRPEKPKHGDAWGDWWYNADNFTLEYKSWQHYYVDLERCTTSAETMDWIFQIATKSWATPEVLGHLIQALDDVLEPQANLCSGGSNKTMDVRSYLQKQVASSR